MIWSSIGDGCLGVVVGKLMGWFSYNWLLYSIGMMNVALVFVMMANERVLVNEDLRIKKEGKLEKLINQAEKTDTSHQHFYLHKETGMELR